MIYAHLFLPRVSKNKLTTNKQKQKWPIELSTVMKPALGRNTSPGGEDLEWKGQKDENSPHTEDNFCGLINQTLCRDEDSRERVVTTHRSTSATQETSERLLYLSTVLVFEGAAENVALFPLLFSWYWLKRLSVGERSMAGERGCRRLHFNHEF